MESTELLVKEIERVVRETIREEMARCFFHEIASYVDEEEMAHLRKELGKPEDYLDEEFEVIEH